MILKLVGNEKLSSYITKFNENDNEIYKQFITNNEALDFLRGNIPLIDIPDKKIEEITFNSFKI